MGGHNTVLFQSEPFDQNSAQKPGRKKNSTQQPGRKKNSTQQTERKKIIMNVMLSCDALNMDKHAFYIEKRFISFCL